MFAPDSPTPTRRRNAFDTLPADLQDLIRRQAKAACTEPVEPVEVTEGTRTYNLACAREAVRFPFRPAPGHWLGLDDAGRDVLARIVYGLRTSLSFGLILVVCSLTVGTILGSVQGYLGGYVDITGQRLIEIWSALPFLYIIILMGSIYGPGFWLMIFCYALFNWIGISYYMRAEMLRLRRLPFVESARCLGLPGWKIVFRHILPNAVVPLITFFPFSLVGAIGSLAALDYLGFGLPPPTPSLGQLLQQAQSQRWAWWLILYPSATLFLVMLLGVFVGEGVREAFDPRQHTRLE
ncbi:MAG: ABC transporter permease subunit [Lentisphaerae bacterium]|nr:ABC transporter permease subunit [Lentisphaerota bacterium]